MDNLHSSEIDRELMEYNSDSSEIHNSDEDPEYLLSSDESNDESIHNSESQDSTNSDVSSVEKNVSSESDEANIIIDLEVGKASDNGPMQPLDFGGAGDGLVCLQSSRGGLKTRGGGVKTRGGGVRTRGGRLPHCLGRVRTRVRGLDRSNNTRPKPPPYCTWKDVNQSFQPRHKVPVIVQPVVFADVNRGSSELDCFLKLFPKSLFMYVSQCTNKRLEILEEKIRKPIQKTNQYDIMVVVGVLLIMSYNKLPSLRDYWSSHKSMGNEAIKSAISRNRFQLLLSKIYFNDPEKPADASKTYYIDEVISCLKKTFLQSRSESTFQSIDESMTKFKGRSCLKQYQPLKPIKRGIKMWVRSDARTGYIYDMNIYCGKEMSDVEGTLGERVVSKLASTIRGDPKNVMLAFDRFFNSVQLIDKIYHPAVATCITNRQNMPKFEEALGKYESDFLENGNGTIAARWHDSKVVMVLSNCHSSECTQVLRTKKNGNRDLVSCPQAIALYNEKMGGVDIADHRISVYDLDRKSTKWWRKVFYKTMMMAVVNSMIIFEEIMHRKMSLIDYIVPLAEQLIAFGRIKAIVKRGKSKGRPSKRFKTMIDVGSHLPIQGISRRRCSRCSQNKKETRTKTFCKECEVPLCKDCFTPYHM